MRTVTRIVSGLFLGLFFAALLFAAGAYFWPKMPFQTETIDRSQPVLLAGERSLFVAAGTVNAYVDFSTMAEGDLTLSEDGTSVEIRLPEAQLDKPNIDQERSYLYSQERGVVNRIGDAISPQDQQDLYLHSEQKLAAAAEESELVERAEANTKEMLTGMFGALELDVTFVDEGDDGGIRCTSIGHVDDGGAAETLGGLGIGAVGEDRLPSLRTGRRPG
ncbi:DUF4230 domain-containing protein [Ornithinimicrobium panacihumi]|uniref:DUF4230 domain-containing protein n=1 Tax=Ornithinimicrobium panacihumi TaxID=2008449 RepID=UPI003F897548